jgi:pilus assembly protein CpaD
MLSRSLLLPALAPVLLIAGCMGTQNRGLESIHQPVVSRQDYVFDVRTSGDGLAIGEAARLDGWLQAMKLRYGDRVAIDDPASGRGLRDDVQPVVSRYGLVLGNERPVVTAAPVAPGTARIVVSRMQATVRGCPDWSRNASQEFDSNTSSNFGCATNSSLAAMIANPEDLVHGEAVGITDQARSTKAIEAFRKAPPSGAGGGAK